MTALPVASTRQLRSYARRLALRHTRELTISVGLQLLAAASGLVVPWLLGNLVAAVTRGDDTVVRTVTLIGLFLVCQAVLIRFAMYASARLGEKVLAELREEFIRDVLALPPGIVEDAGTGDLVARTTRDGNTLSDTVRSAIPETMTAAAAIVITVGALVLIGPLLVLPCLMAVPILFSAARWYLKRARVGYLAEAASYSRL